MEGRPLDLVVWGVGEARPHVITEYRHQGWGEITEAEGEGQSPECIQGAKVSDVAEDKRPSFIVR